MTLPETRYVRRTASAPACRPTSHTRWSAMSNTTRRPVPLPAGTPGAERWSAVRAAGGLLTDADGDTVPAADGVPVGRATAAAGAASTEALPCETGRASAPPPGSTPIPPRTETRVTTSGTAGGAQPAVAGAGRRRCAAVVACSAVACHAGQPRPVSAPGG